MSIGIGTVHCVLPEECVPVEKLPEYGMLGHDEAEFVAASGIRTVGVLGEEGVAHWATRAALGLLERSTVEPDVLLLVGPRAPDVLLGSDVCRVQAQTKLSSALPLTVDGLGCTGSSAAWGLARDLLLADPHRDSVLVVHASLPASLDRVRYPVTVIGDGAYAMTLTRGGRPVMVAHRVEADGTFNDLFQLDYRQAPRYEWREVCASVDRYRFDLAMHSRLRLSRLVDDVLAEAGVGRDAVAATLMQNVTAGAYDFYTTLLGLPIHPVCAEHLGRYGHLGAMDVVLNLDALMRGGDLKEGDLVLVLNNSPVAAWAVTLWQI